MGTALSVVDIITEAEHVFLEFVDILERTFYGNALRFPFEINRIVDCLFVLIQIAHKTNNAVRLVIRQVLLFSIAQIGKINGKRRVQICSLMETAFDLCCGKRVFSKISGSGRKLMRVPLFFVFPIFGSSPSSSSSCTATPRS